MSNLERTGLFDLHVALGAKMVPFAGYEMPVQYPMGVLKEHLHCRAQAGLFDVSHMGQVILRGAGVAEAFEALMPVDVLGVTQGRQRYGMFTNDAGGIMDDLMFANRGDHLFVVVNAACKEADIAHMQTHLAGVCEVIPITDRALLALQGPQAEAALARLVPEVVAIETFLGRVDVRLNVIARDMAHYQEVYRARILALPHIAEVDALMLISTIKNSEGLPL